MAKKPYLIFLVLLFSFCQDSEWQYALQNQVDTYNKTAKEVDSYDVDTGSFAQILVKQYEERYGLQKIVVHHYRDATMNFERHLLLKDGEIVYTHYIGIAPTVNTSDESSFLIFNQQSFWKNTEKGVELKQQLFADSFKKKDEVLQLLENTGVLEKATTPEDYGKIKRYYDEITASKPKNDRR
ncbi:MAG: hypothetical protein AAGB24_08980 [Bacteroidota bacterium]